MALTLANSMLRISLFGPRGELLVDAFADLGASCRARGMSHSKITWCELATGLSAPNGHAGGRRVTRAESLVTLFGEVGAPREARHTHLSIALAEESAIDVITDLSTGYEPTAATRTRHWIGAKGHFEAEVRARESG
ncbi:hypothetical protein [Streptomyces sp. NPDC048527]|uniref:hypothetical protein n=1 Tax=Streptomyces sp. NPDC048527 TaxID=3365568 RepID=UPI003710754C